MTTFERPKTRLWTCDEYHRASELGLFGPDERLELLEGEIITKVSPQSKPHAQSIVLTAEALRRLFSEGYHIREEKPLVLTDRSEPEPDIVVVRGTSRQSPDHPTPATAVLVVEVSESTLTFDRTEKAVAYARSGIAEYWIVNLRARCLEVHRDPGPVQAEETGYRSKQTLAEDGEIAPLEKPGYRVAVADLLPLIGNSPR